MKKRALIAGVMFAAAAISAARSGRAAPQARSGAGSAPAMEGRSTIVIQPASRDSLEAMVRFVSVDPVSGQSRSRFALREAPLALVADSLVARLERYTGNPVDRLSFTIHQYDSSFGAQNLVARITGTGAVDGVLLVSAHYDAIGLRTPGWSDHWQTWAAPGADDNGTGVAAVMEAARVVPHGELPFDVMFVLFSGEELDRLGSRDFVSRYRQLYGERIIGVLNADMLGYAFTGSPGGDVLSNYTSGWLADMMAQSARASDPALPLSVLLPGPSNFDHASFWDSSYAAVTFAEPLDAHGSIANPWYHTLGDTLGTIDFGLAERLTNLMIRSVEYLASGSAEIGIFPTDLAILWRGGQTLQRNFAVGDTIFMRIRVRNRGAEAAPRGSTGRLLVSADNDRGSRTLLSESLDLPAALDYRQVTVPVVLGGASLGGNSLRVQVTVAGMDDDPLDNTAEVWIGVEGTGEEEAVLMHSIQPNPIAGRIGSAAFCINLARPVDIALELYTLEGERIGSAFAGARWGRPLGPGLNCLELGSLFPGLSRLASGVYIYRLVLYEEGAPRRKYPGRFAVEN